VRTGQLRVSSAWWLAAAVFIVVLGTASGVREQALKDVRTPDAPRDTATPSPATLKNPVPQTSASIAAGKQYYDGNCSACHGDRAQGAVKAGTAISITDEQKGRQPPDLTDDRWDHGSSDGEIFAVIKRGLPPTLMAGFDGGIPDQDIWNIVNYLRSLRPAR